MDYYQKYLKYKIKYMRLKEQIEGGGNNKKGEKCTEDKNCANDLYCSKAFLTKNTCQTSKSTGADCNRARQCKSYNCKIPSHYGIHGSAKCA